MTDPRPFFIIGSGRSGTTAMCRVLATATNAQVDVEAPPKMCIAARQMHDNALPDPAAYLRCAVLPKVLRGQRLAEFYGDKNPNYARFVPVLHELLDCRFVFVVRDGRDVVRSAMDFARERTPTYHRYEDWPAPDGASTGPAGNSGSGEPDSEKGSSESPVAQASCSDILNAARIKQESREAGSVKPDTACATDLGSEGSGNGSVLSGSVGNPEGPGTRLCDDILCQPATKAPFATVTEAEDDFWDYARPRPRPGEAYFDTWRELSFFEKHCWLWNSFNTLLLQHAARLPKQSFRFFDITRATVDDYRELFAFLGLRGFDEKRVTELTARRINGTTSANRFPHWKDWSGERTTEFLRHCEKTMQHFGYLP